MEAKANDLALRLKATKALPPPVTAAARRLFRFSLRLKLSSVVIHVESKYKPSIWPSPLQFFKSKFAANKFRRRTTPATARATLNIPPPPRWMAMTIIKGWDYFGGGDGSSSALLRNLYLLRQWISRKDQNGIVVNVSGWTGAIRYVASSVLKKNNVGFGRELSTLLVLLVSLMLLVATFGPSSLRCGYRLLSCAVDHSKPR